MRYDRAMVRRLAFFAIALVSGLAIPALFLAAFAALLFRGLLRPAVARWLDEV